MICRTANQVQKRTMIFHAIETITFEFEVRIWITCFFWKMCVCCSSCINAYCWIFSCLLFILSISIYFFKVSCTQPLSQVHESFFCSPLIACDMLIPLIQGGPATGGMQPLGIYSHHAEIQGIQGTDGTFGWLVSGIPAENCEKFSLFKW